MEMVEPTKCAESAFVISGDKDEEFLLCVETEGTYYRVPIDRAQVERLERSIDNILYVRELNL